MNHSKSEIDCFFQCPRAHKFKYRDGYESALQSKEQKFGLDVHAWLERYLSPSMSSVAFDWSKCLTDGLERQKVSKLVSGWATHVRHPSDRMLAVEHAWEVPGVGKGVFDAVFEDDANDDNGILVYEHKTTKTDLQNADWYWEKLRSDLQVGLYQLAAAAIYKRPVTVWYNVLRVPQLRQGKAEGDSEYIARIAEHIDANPGAYFQQARIKWPAERLDNLRQWLPTVAEAIANSNGAPSFRCFDFNRKCDFASVCWEGDSLQNEKLYRLRSKR